MSGRDLIPSTNIEQARRIVHHEPIEELGLIAQSANIMGSTTEAGRQQIASELERLSPGAGWNDRLKGNLIVIEIPLNMDIFPKDMPQRSGPYISIKDTKVHSNNINDLCQSLARHCSDDPQLQQHAGGAACIPYYAATNNTAYGGIYLIFNDVTDSRPFEDLKQKIDVEIERANAPHVKEPDGRNYSR